jgi:hypothetical protein
MIVESGCDKTIVFPTRGVVALPLMRRLTHLLVLVAFIFSCGGHWCVLQGVAWIGMIHQYSKIVPLGEAVSMTLSGRYPCALCKAIAEKKEAERLQLLTMEKHEKKFFSPLWEGLPSCAASPVQYPEFVMSWEMRSEAPPTPPPRLS